MFKISGAQSSNSDLANQWVGERAKNLEVVWLVANSAAGTPITTVSVFLLFPFM